METSIKKATQPAIAGYTMLANVNSKIKSNCIIVDCAVTKQGKYVVCAFANEADEAIFELFTNAQDMDERVHYSLLEMFKNIDCDTVITDCSIAHLPKVQYLFKKLRIRQIIPKALQRTIRIEDETQIVPLHKVERRIRALTLAF